MALSRESRMLILILAFGIGSVVVLAWMADRYTKMLQPAEGATNRADSATPSPAKGPVEGEGVDAPPLTPEERASRALSDARKSLDRFIGVRVAVRRAGEQLAKSAPGGLQVSHREILMAQLDRELRHAGLPPRDYRNLSRVYELWRAGESLDEPFKTAFVERETQLEEASWDSLPILSRDEKEPEAS